VAAASQTTDDSDASPASEGRRRPAGSQGSSGRLASCCRTMAAAIGPDRALHGLRLMQCLGGGPPRTRTRCRPEAQRPAPQLKRGPSAQPLARAPQTGEGRQRTRTQRKPMQGHRRQDVAHKTAPHAARGMRFRGRPGQNVRRRRGSRPRETCEYDGTCSRDHRGTAGDRSASTGSRLEREPQAAERRLARDTVPPYRSNPILSTPSDGSPARETDPPPRTLHNNTTTRTHNMKGWTLL